VHKGEHRITFCTACCAIGAREKNARAMYLMVTSNNEAAISFYESLRFEKTGHTEPYPNDPALIEYEMILTL
jgi:ribosomal protein S18 acetylase RimI-like enzyme